jgi:hypothetical protein
MICGNWLDPADKRTENGGWISVNTVMEFRVPLKAKKFLDHVTNEEYFNEYHVPQSFYFIY